MKKSRYLLLCLLISICLCGCMNKKEFDAIPDITQIKAICDLATLETYYHNVAKYTKQPDSGISHIFEVERELWIEYTGKAKIGIDLSKVNMEINGENIKIYIPQAKVLEIGIAEISKDSFISNEDGWLNKNQLTAADETEAISFAQEEMRKSVENNSQLLLQARNRAQELIENYILQLGEISGIDYNIEWDYIDD